MKVRVTNDETPNFLVVTNPEDFALVNALYRCSIDGRKFMYEAILSDDNKYDIPDKFTSRTVEILQTYLKSLGVKMTTVINEDEYVIEPEHKVDQVEFIVGDTSIFCTTEQMYYLKKLGLLYQRYLKDNSTGVNDPDEVWEYIMDNLPFKKKYLTDEIIDMFRKNIVAFGMAGNRFKTKPVK